MGLCVQVMSNQQNGPATGGRQGSRTLRTGRCHGHILHVQLLQRTLDMEVLYSKRSTPCFYKNP